VAHYAGTASKDGSRTTARLAPGDDEGSTAMILRIYHARTAAADRGLLFAHLRDVVYPANVSTPGMRTFQAGLRAVDSVHLEFVLVSTWVDYDAMLAGIGPDLLRPRWFDAISHRLEPLRADHYELVGEELRGIVPFAGGAVRVFTGRLAPGGEAFFEVARRAQSEQLDVGDIIASHIGRRLDELGEEAAYVDVWRDGDAPALFGGSPSEPGDRAEWEGYFSSHTFEVFDAVARVPSRRGSEHALLLADDDRRYVFASQAAARLLGQPAARILGRRIEDVTAPSKREGVDELWRSFVATGSQSSDFALTRADGSVVEVHYEARANTPWPGVHASVLAAPSEAFDFDDALAASGILARYDLVETA
jgi:PAS domain S-box-containing protein